MPPGHTAPKRPDLSRERSGGSVPRPAIAGPDQGGSRARWSTSTRDSDARIPPGRQREEHTVRADIVPGGKFPDYELTDHTKKRRRLSELQGDDPLILVLSRGHFCPKDNQQHLQLAAFQSQVAVAYTSIVTISTDNIVVTRDRK